MDSNNKSDREPLIPKHGGYRNLKSFQLAQLVFDVTVRFCDKHIDRRSRTHDQMVQAARSGVQNIAEGSQASGTSKKTELKLTNVARASLEELRLDYEDFLRQRGFLLWERDDSRRRELVARRPKTADEVAEWVREVCGREDGRYGRDGQYGRDGRNAADPAQSPRPGDSAAPAHTPSPGNSAAPAQPPRPGDSAAPAQPPRPGDSAAPAQPPSPGNSTAPAQSPRPGDSTPPAQSPRPGDSVPPAQTPSLGNSAAPAHAASPTANPNGEAPALSIPSIPSIPSIKHRHAEASANAVLVLIGVACALLDRQLSAQADTFGKEGGFTERLYRTRTQRRGDA